MSLALNQKADSRRLQLLPSASARRYVRLSPMSCMPSGAGLSVQRGSHRLIGDSVRQAAHSYAAVWRAKPLVAGLHREAPGDFALLGCLLVSWYLLVLIRPARLAGSDMAGTARLEAKTLQSNHLHASSMGCSHSLIGGRLLARVAGH